MLALADAVQAYLARAASSSEEVRYEAPHPPFRHDWRSFAAVAAIPAVGLSIGAQRLNPTFPT